MVDRKQIAILGSGAGSNAEAICKFSNVQADCAYSVALIISTSRNAGICDVATTYSIPLVVIDTAHDVQTQISSLIDKYGIDLLALAGYMKLLPNPVIAQLRGKVLNIHPALLPRFGGKGMYGIHVHRAVIDAKALKTGATVHLVTDHYDEGSIIAQDELHVPTNSSAEELQAMVKVLEHHIYPRAISAFIRKT